MDIGGEQLQKNLETDKHLDVEVRVDASGVEEGNTHGVIRERSGGSANEKRAEHDSTNTLRSNG